MNRQFSATVQHALSDFESVVIVEAEDEDEVRTSLTQRGFFVYEIIEEGDDA